MCSVDTRLYCVEWERAVSLKTYIGTTAFMIFIHSFLFGLRLRIGSLFHLSETNRVLLIYLRLFVWLLYLLNIVIGRGNLS